MKTNVIEPVGIIRDTFFKGLIEIINEVFVYNLPFELEIDKLLCIFIYK